MPAPGAGTSSPGHESASDDQPLPRVSLTSVARTDLDNPHTVTSATATQSLAQRADPGQDRVGRARREAVWLAGAQLSASTA